MPKGVEVRFLSAAHGWDICGETVYKFVMKIDSIYLGTWFPRTHIHLDEVYDFLKDGLGTDLDGEQLANLRQKLAVKNLKFNGGADLDSVEFTSEEIGVNISEDGVVQLMTGGGNGAEAGTKMIESFYVDKLGPALAYLFSRGAPLPRTLVDIAEMYPKIFVGSGISQEKAVELLMAQGTELLSVGKSQGVQVFYGKNVEIINVSSGGVLPGPLITNIIFINSFSDLLKRYLVAHRRVWSDIDSIRRSKGIKYSDFPLIRNKILESLKNISFIKTRLLQMMEILSAREAVIKDVLRKKLEELGFENFKVLGSSCAYSDNLWQMTSDYAHSTLALFESLVAENTQRELRLLQSVTVIGVLTGFFGMNIAFPWEDRWPEIFVSSFVVVGVIILVIGIFYSVIKRVIENRRFTVFDTQ